MSVRGEPIVYSDAIGREFSPIDLGHRWGPPWSTTWFHVKGRVPASWSGQGVVAFFDLGFIRRHCAGIDRVRAVLRALWAAARRAAWDGGVRSPRSRDAGA